MIITAQSLLLKKISLESKWNQSYLEQGCVTPEMKWIDLDLKKVKKEMIDLDLVSAKEEINKELDYAS